MRICPRCSEEKELRLNGICRECDNARYRERYQPVRGGYIERRLTQHDQAEATYQHVEALGDGTTEQIHDEVLCSIEPEIFRANYFQTFLRKPMRIYGWKSC